MLLRRRRPPLCWSQSCHHLCHHHLRTHRLQHRHGCHCHLLAACHLLQPICHHPQPLIYRHRLRDQYALHPEFRHLHQVCQVAYQCLVSYHLQEVHCLLLSHHHRRLLFLLGEYVVWCWTLETLVVVAVKLNPVQLLVDGRDKTALCCVDVVIGSYSECI